MALEIVGWFVSAVLSGLVNTSLEYFKNHTGLKDEVEKLKLCIPKIESVVCEAEKRQIADNPGLKKWMWILKVTLFEAEDVLDELEYLRIEKQATSSSKNIVYPNKKIKFTWVKEEGSSSNSSQKLEERAKRFLNLDPTLKKLKAVVEKLNKIGNDLDPFLKIVREQSLISNVRSSHNDQRSRGPCLTKETPILGREEEKEELINQLLCLQSSRTEVQRNVNKVGVSVIVGEGGLGKTTLAQLVCNDDKVKQHFKPENIWWVTVSDDFVLDLLAKEIYNAVFKREPDVNGFDFIQAELKTKLESKTFLLVLDDVWDDMRRASWSQVISLLEHGKHGSKILVTTRFESVARMVKTTSDPIHLTRLEEEASWELLKEVCLPYPEDQAKHPELLEIGKKIAKKLKGSPLAAKVVGGMLNDKLDERYWDSIYQTDMCNFDDIMSVLKMSYQHLPTYLQPLFRYCSIFPPDHEFDKEQLIYMWVGAGLILQEKDQEQDLEDLGGCYFEDLLRRSFFKEISLGYKKTTRSNRYIMHDLLHELARNVSDGECCRVSGDRFLDIPIPLTTQHLSVETAELLENKNFFKKMSQLKHLRTLCLRFHCNWDSRAEDEAPLINKLLETLTSIRVLDLPEDYEREQSTWINKLIHLRYLGAAYVSIAPLGRLHLLQFLISSGPPPTIPVEHLFLPRLRHFTWLFKGLWSFPELGAPRNLTMLRELNICLKKERGYKISELCNLVELRYLNIRGLENVSGSEEAGEANMKEKHHLKELYLRWNPDSNDELRTTSEAVFDGLEPHVDLKEMLIRGYPGSRAPCWFQTYSFKSKLEQICIDNCPNWKDMSFLQHLPSLMELRIWNMEALERIGTPEVSRGCQLFPKLRILDVSSCRLLKTLPPLPLGLKVLYLKDVSLTTLPEWTVQDNETSWLSKLYIRYCPNLISLKEGLLREFVKLKHLKKVEIVDCPKLVHLPDLLPTSLSDINLYGCSSITSLDLSGLTALENLEIASCGALESVNLQGTPGIRDLLPTSLSDIVLINCTSITSLDLSGLIALEKLQIADCEALESVNLQGTPGIRDLLPTSLSDIDLNGCSSITSLDLSGLTALEKLQIADCEALESVNLQGTPGIRDLLPTSLSDIVLNCCFSITSLDLSGLTALEKLQIADCGALESVNLQGTPGIRDLLPTFLSDIFLFDCTSITSLDLSGLTALEKLKIADCGALESVNLQGTPGIRDLLPTSLSDIVLINCTSITSLDLSGLTALEKLQIADCGALESVNLQGTPGIRDLLPTSLSDIDLNGCSSITSLDLSGLTALEKLQIADCEALESVNLQGTPGIRDLLPTSLSDIVLNCCFSITSLDLSGLTALEKLQIADCGALESVNLQGTPGIRDLLPTFLSDIFLFDCTSITSLDLSGLTALEKLKIADCGALESVNLQGTPGIRDLLPTSLSDIVLINCTSITSLDLSGLTALEKLQIADCGALESVNLQGTPGIRDLLPTSLSDIDLNGCSSITSLDLSGLTALEKLQIADCEALESVNLQGTPGIRDLLPTSLSDIDLNGCSSITYLDLSGLTALEKLEIDSCGALESVNLQGTPGIQDLLPTSLSNIILTVCSEITSLDLSGLTALKTLVIYGCCKLESVEGLENLASLTRVDIKKCPQLPHNRTLQQNEYLTYTYVL